MKYSCRMVCLNNLKKPLERQNKLLGIKERVIYFIIKTAHVLFVIGWLACVFVLPRVILHWKMAVGAGKETETVELLSLKLFRFGLLMFCFAVGLGAWLWVGFGIHGAWLNIKLLLVLLLFVYFCFSGWLMFRAVKSKVFLSNIAMRLFNESSLLFVIPIIYLALSKNA